MRALVFPVALALALAPGAGIAQGYDGSYALGDCAAAGEGAVTLAGATITFYESACRLSGATRLSGFEAATLYEASCAGEGETWQETLLLMPALEDGLVVVAQGWASVYARCP